MRFVEIFENGITVVVTRVHFGRRKNFDTYVNLTFYYLYLTTYDTSGLTDPFGMVPSVSSLNTLYVMTTVEDGPHPVW